MGVCGYSLEFDPKLAFRRGTAVVLNSIGAIRMGPGEGGIQSCQARRFLRGGEHSVWRSAGDTVRDPDHSEDEERLLTTGVSNKRRVVIVWHTEQDEVVRIIGAREATSLERRTYESGE